MYHPGHFLCLPTGIALKGEHPKEEGYLVFSIFSKGSKIVSDGTGKFHPPFQRWRGGGAEPFLAHCNGRNSQGFPKLRRGDQTVRGTVWPWGTLARGSPSFTWVGSIKPEKEKSRSCADSGGDQEGKGDKSVAGKDPDKKFNQVTDGRSHKTKPEQALDKIEDFFRAGIGVSSKKPGYFFLKTFSGDRSLPFHRTPSFVYLISNDIQNP